MVDGEPRYLNLLRLLQDPDAPEVSILALSPQDIFAMFETSSMMFHEVCSSLFISEPSELTIEDDDSSDADVERSVAESEDTEEEEGSESDRTSEWFAKTLLSKDASTPMGRVILMGRLIQLTAFLTDIAASEDATQREHIKNMVRDHLVANSEACPDRAVSGLDDIEFDIHLFHSPNLDRAIHTLIRQYKRQVIRESLVSHEFAESVEEYLYLLLLLNKSFNLGIAFEGIHSAECGSRKPFDTAARLLMDSLSIEGFCHYASRLPSFHRFLMLQPEYQEEMISIVTEADGAEDRLSAFARSIVEPRIYEQFVISGDKYQELSPENLDQLRTLAAALSDAET